MSSTSGPPRRHHHHENFPPQQYTDLRGSDISLLAPIFAPKPPHPSPKFAAHEADVRKRIGELPSHLRSKLAILSNFCSVHKQLNSLPITSILSFTQDEVTPAALFHWAPVERSSWLDKNTIALLEEMNCIWQSPSTFQSNYRRIPNPVTRWSFINHKCAACKLTEIANNVPGIVALGGVTIARLNPANWKKSKRIQWFEKWIAVSVEREDQTEGVMKAMWECGVKLRNAMGTSSGETPARRAYIDDFVAQTRTPVRPARSETQESHVADAERLMSGGGGGGGGMEKMDEGEGSDTPSIKTIRLRFPPTPPNPPRQGTAAPVAEPSAEQQPQGKLPTRYIPSVDFFGRIQKSFHEDDSRTLINPAAVQTTPPAPRRPVSSVYSQPGGGGVGARRVASSIYSRATDDDGGGYQRWDSQENWFQGSVLEEDEFIDSYGRASKGSGEVKRDVRGFI